MAKKHAAPNTAIEPGKSEPTPETVGPQQPAAEKKPNPFKDAKPSRYLKDSAGKEFRITPRPLPKKAAVVGKITVDGVESDLQVTNNKGFSPPENVTYYSWFTLPDKSTGFIAHDYLVEPKAGEAYTLHTGLSERKDPARVPKSTTVGADRVAKFKEAQAKKAAAKGSAPAEAGSTPPTA